MEEGITPRSKEGEMNKRGSDDGERARAKRQAPELEFKCCIGQPATMRTLVDMLLAVVPSCEFKVEKTPEFTGLKIMRIDNTRSCMVSAQLRCDVEMPGGDEEASFAVSLKEMSAFMRVVHSHYIMELNKPRVGDKVKVVSRDSVNESMINSFEMNLLAEDYDKRVIPPKDYDYTLIVDLPDFRTIVKMCKDLGSEQLRFTIFERNDEETRTMVLRLQINGLNNSAANFFFRSVINDSGQFAVTSCDPCNVEHLDESDEWTQKYEADFKQERLSTFIRSMDRAKVTLRVSNNLPLIVIFSLGGDDSYLYYILAPSIND